LLDAAESARERALFAVMLWGGLRVSEACGLDLNDVHWREEQLHIQAGKGDNEGYVYAHPDCLAEIRTYLPERMAPKEGEGAPLFTSTHRRRLCARHAWNLVRDAGVRAAAALPEDAGVVREVLANLHPHSLRHSCGTRLAENGADLVTIRDHLRHADITTTQIYVEIANEQLKKAVQGM
jgi:site-specific recombinase XerD